MTKDSMQTNSNSQSAPPEQSASSVPHPAPDTHAASDTHAAPNIHEAPETQTTSDTIQQAAPSQDISQTTQSVAPPPQGAPYVLNNHETTQAPQGVPHSAPQGTPYVLINHETTQAPQGVPQSAPPQGAPLKLNPQLYQSAPQSHQPPQSVQPLRFKSSSRKHVHHSYMWYNTLLMVFVLIFMALIILVPLLIEGVPSNNALTGVALSAVTVGAVIVIVGLTALYTVLSYRNLFYELDEDEFNLYSGIISKKRVHVPYQRIQSVNQKATLFQRIIGVCTVSIDTAGGASNKAVVVPYLQNTEAELLRYELFARKQAILGGSAGLQSAQQTAQGYENPLNGTATTVPGYPPPANQSTGNVLDTPAEIMADIRGVFGNQAFDTGAVVYKHGLTNKELILTALSNNTSFAFIVMTVLVALVGIVTEVSQSAVGQWLYESGISVVFDSAPSSMGMWIVVGITVIALLAMWVFSVIGACLSYGGFKALRRGSRIEVERGLLQHHFHGVDIDRVQSVIIKQSFIRKLFGYCELSLGKIDAMTGDSEDQQEKANLGLVVHPFVKMSRVPEILSGLVPEFADVPTDTKPVAKQALRRVLIRRGILFGSGFWLAILTTVGFLIATQFVLPTVTRDVESDMMYIMIGTTVLYVLSLILLSIDVVGAVLWYRGSSYAYNRSFMQVTNGGFSRTRVFFPRKKIQYGFTQSNPFQRRARVRTINARTAAGIGGTTLKLLDVYEDDAYKWLDWVRPRQGTQTN